MADNSSIEWTDATWNPVTGCTKISAGCDNCYAERFSERFRDTPGHPFENGFDLTLRPQRLDQPLSWRRPRMIFVNSMSDLFHPDVPDAFIMQVVETMMLARWHTYQVLTKRPDRLKRMLNGPLRRAAAEKHIWWGVSVENRKHGVPRIADLQATPAAVRFLSVEPLLEDVGVLQLDGISWVIVGGESGPGARPMEESWVVSLQKQCKAARVPFFFKQWGGVRKKVRGRTLQGRTHDGFPKRVKNPTLPTTLRMQHALEIERSALVQIATV
jgi:protein gp37